MFAVGLPVIPPSLPGSKPNNAQHPLVTVVNRVVKKVARNKLKPPMIELAKKTRSELIRMLVTARDNANRLANVRAKYNQFVNSLLANNEQKNNLNARARNVENQVFQLMNTNSITENSFAKVSAKDEPVQSLLPANVQQATNSMTRAQIISNLESHLTQINKTTAAGKGAP
jgi:hypothetical protein